MPCGYTLDARPLEPVQIVGDLTKLRGGADLPAEEIEIEVIANAATCFDRQSPLVLMGDSHVLVYSAGGDLHAKDAGLPEHLSRRVAEPIDLIGVRGSGASATRIDLLRRKDGMAGKKWVVWVFAARDLTESDGWRHVPVIPK
jgi:alginate O-acetyltransferase complex protein AlgJ